MGVTFEQAGGRDKELAARPGIVRFLDATPTLAVMIDGEGAAGQATFGSRMPGLYGTAYSLHFILKRRGVAHRTGLLEGLYWTADGSTDLDVILGPDRGHWRWTLMIPLPAEAAADELDAALAAGRARLAPALADALRVETFHEGLVAQLLHVGPYEAERPTIEQLHVAIAGAGLRPRGRHHEIYLGDPRRAALPKLRTLLRQPVEPA